MRGKTSVRSQIAQFPPRACRADDYFDFVIRCNDSNRLLRHRYLKQKTDIVQNKFTVNNIKFGDDLLKTALSQAENSVISQPNQITACVIPDVTADIAKLRAERRRTQAQHVDDN